MPAHSPQPVTPPDANDRWQKLPATAQNFAHQIGDSLAFFGDHTRLCFYPSSGANALWALMQLNCDLFVMAEQRPEAVSWRHIASEFKKQGLPVELVQHNRHYLRFTSQGKTAWIFFEDNNITLQRLHRLGLKIHHFVGICDGCAEGGNHECVHERPFLSLILHIAVQGMVYTTDHSGPLERGRPCNWGAGIPNHPKFADAVAWRGFPEPPQWNHPPEPDLSPSVNPSTVFLLQGVLVTPANLGSSDNGGRLRAADLVVLPKGNYPSQLECLKPFRTQYSRGVLAEYRVCWDEC